MARVAANANTDMYNKIRVEEGKRAKSMSDKENKRSRENNFIVYGMPDRLTVEGYAEEFMEASSVLDIKPRIEVVSRLGNNIRNDTKPRPIRFQLGSKRKTGCKSL